MVLVKNPDFFDHRFFVDYLAGLMPKKGQLIQWFCAFFSGYCLRDHDEVIRNAALITQGHPEQLTDSAGLVLLARHAQLLGGQVGQLASQVLVLGR